jgi:toxin ParE1/3/4
MALRFSPASENDLQEIHEFIAADKPLAANEFVNRLERACERLMQYPLLGQSCDGVRPGLRMLTEGNYVIVYRMSGEHIEVVRVLHGSRDWHRLL